jgi:hypothetical protein
MLDLIQNILPHRIFSRLNVQWISYKLLLPWLVLVLGTQATALVQGSRLCGPDVALASFAQPMFKGKLT